MRSRPKLQDGRGLSADERPNTLPGFGVRRLSLGDCVRKQIRSCIRVNARPETVAISVHWFDDRPRIIASCYACTLLPTCEHSYLVSQLSCEHSDPLMLDLLQHCVVATPHGGKLGGKQGYISSLHIPPSRINPSSSHHFSTTNTGYASLGRRVLAETSVSTYMPPSYINNRSQFTSLTDGEFLPASESTIYHINPSTISGVLC